MLWQLLYSKVTQWNMCMYIFFLKNVIFHHGLSQTNLRKHLYDLCQGYRPLCSSVRTCYWSFLNVIVCIYHPQTPCPSHSHFKMSFKLFVFYFKIHKNHWKKYIALIWSISIASMGDLQLQIFSMNTIWRLLFITGCIFPNC